MEHGSFRPTRPRTGRVLRRALALLALALAAGPSVAGSEILWDAWGVPHIYADSQDELVHAWGWAQMQAHGDRILEQVGIVRGRAAAIWGETYLASDRYLWTMGMPQLVERLAPELDPDDAFVAGMNAWAEAHPGQIGADLDVVLPVRNEDVLALALYAEFFNGIVVTPTFVDGLREAYLSGDEVRDPRPDRGATGSNAWAIGADRSSSGHPLLLANPHAPWPSLQEARHLLFFEAHLVGPDLDAYGAGVIGLPALTFGFNGDLGWTGTSAPTFDYVDAYELTLEGSGYRFDGDVRAFDEEAVTLDVLAADGSTRRETLNLRRSVHGPVLAEKDGHAIAIAFPLPDEEEAANPQLWAMMRAHDLDAFLSTLEAQNLFALNFLYADRRGHIAYALTGVFPDRPDVDVDWSAVVPGDTSATLWRGKLPFERMPVVVDPPSDRLQNANETPHYVAWPDVLDLADAPPDWPAPDAWPRTRRSLALISGQDRFTPGDVMRLKYDTRSGLADQVLDTVVAAGREYGSAEAQAAAELLAAWDRRFDQDSVGAVVFAFWAMHFQPDALGGARFPADAYAVAFDPEAPMATPAGLADPGMAVEALEFAARAVMQTFGTLEVPWGAFVTFQVGEARLPGFGAPPEAFGVFSPNFAAPTPEGPLATVAGDTWVAVVEFASPPSAWAVLPYGNASRHGDPHVGDQLELYAGKGFRPVWLRRADIEANLERIERFE